MNEKLFRTLEFNKIVELIAQRAVSESARNMILNLNTVSDKRRLRLLHDVLGEAVDISYIKGKIPIEGYKEAPDIISHAQKGGTIREGGLLRIASNLRIAKQVKKYIFAEERSKVSFLLLEEIADELQTVPQLEKDISQAILSETEISDNASSALYDIRRQIRNANASIKDKLSSIINSQENKKYLQDAIVTIRNGRYVVPVKSENKSQINGIVHDSSASGLTLFIEPMAVVNLNNKLRELEAAEQQEIELILKILSEKAKTVSPLLLINEQILIRLDECFAKADYAIVNNHTKPLISDTKQLFLRKAYHPLIDKDKVVSSDISIGEGYTQIVITGPNTGGKTVTLKTLGLCALMGQCGLFIPAAEGSVICMFDEIFADIGDEQSIAQSLSTFSSHMTNIIEILSKVNGNSLVLLDELGAGTDPSEGAALAWAILSDIKSTGALSAATTHYNEIKQYALTNQGVVNASVEFDIVNLKPTYKLHIGIPGKSNAFEISRKLGLNERILSSANHLLTRENKDFEEILSQLEIKLKAAGEAADQAQKYAVENQKINENLTVKLKELETGKDKLIAEAAVEAKKIINDAKASAKDLLAETDKYAKGFREEKQVHQVHKDKINEISKHALDEINRHIPAHDLTKGDAQKTKYKFKKSDEVHIPDLNADGVILSIEGEIAMVQVGMIKTKISINKLEPKKAKKQSGYSYNSMKAKTATNKLDIRGITANEVDIEVEKFLDDAAMANLKIVTIVHGKGNGILRKAVYEVLKNHPLVESSRIGGLNEGGEGATIVYLK